MYKNKWIVLMVFIVIILVICISKDLPSAVSVLALMSTFLVLCSHLDAACTSEPLESDRKPEAQEESEAHMSEEPAMREPVTHIPAGTGIMGYPAHSEYEKYVQTYGVTHPPMVYVHNTSELAMGMDEQAARLAQKRSRDRRSMEGAVLKDASFYAHHYANDFRESENKPWWGRSEY